MADCYVERVIGGIRRECHPADTLAWLPRYFAQWRGKSAHRNVLLDRRPAFIQGEGNFSGAPTRDISAIATFQESFVEQALNLLLLPLTTPLSVLAVEFLPPGTDRPPEPVRDNLGQVRVLRTSPLTPVPPIC